MKPHRVLLLALVPSVLIVVLWLRIERIQQRLADLEANSLPPWDQGVDRRGGSTRVEVVPSLRVAEGREGALALAERVEQLSRRMDALEGVGRVAADEQAVAALLARLEEWASSDSPNRPPARTGGDAAEAQAPRRVPFGVSPVGFAEFAARFQLTEAQQRTIAPIVVETERGLRDLSLIEDDEGRTWTSLDEAVPPAESPSDVVARFKEAYARSRAFGGQMIPGRPVTFSQQDEVIRARGATRIYRELTEAQRMLWDRTGRLAKSLFVVRH